MKRWLTLFLIFVLTASLCCSASASTQTNELDIAVSCLQSNGIMVGDETGNMHLDQELNRAELAAILARMIASQEHLQAEKSYYSSQCSFGDVPEWAKLYVGYCASNLLLFGYGNGVYGSRDPVTSAAACTVMLRCLEGIEGSWTYSTACEKAVEMGIAPDELLLGSTVTRGDMAILAYRTLCRMRGITPPAGSSSDTCTTVPSDGSRYTPAEGDLILCDDGYRYSITDVSKWDKSMFATGPIGPLPDPIDDWSKLPQPKLPQAEARHFSIDGKEYLFLRNLHETRRMLYTLYNAICSDPETWKDGQPVLFPSGNPKVNISLQIDEGMPYQSFWPWRASEIEDMFHSCPPGSYYLESWDVFIDGAFVYTEYCIYVI